jgi:hypothetical protein
MPFLCDGGAMRSNPGKQGVAATGKLIREWLISAAGFMSGLILRQKERFPA